MSSRRRTARYKLVRNHELGEGNDIPPGTVIGIPDYAYDKKTPGGRRRSTVDAATPT